MQAPMKRYPDQFTGWKPGQIVFHLDSVDVDTINRIRGGRAVAIDMRGHMKLRAAAIADLYVSASIDEHGGV